MTIRKEIQEFLLEETIKRFLVYVKIHTTSSEESTAYPSTTCQLDLGSKLKEELLELALDNVVHDEFGYVYADLSASENCENVQPIAFIAHLDTSPAVEGKGVKPIIHENYQGQEIKYPEDSTLTLSVKDSPELESFIGMDIITSSGDTLLGADDKAGIAEIMAALTAWKKYPELEHGKITVCFTPDEEVGKGTAKINLDRLPKFCYTLDGGEMGELETECFDAWKAEFEFNGLSVHPGYAKNKMINAIDVASRFFSEVPKFETPEHTEKREGFYHLYNLSGSAEVAKAAMILRDFEEKENKRRMVFLESLKATYEKRYIGLKIELKFSHSYENMSVYLEPFPDVIKHAETAIEEAGLAVKRTEIRGGTDGARLSAKGIPTPNLFAGGMLFHSRKEYIPTKALQKAAEVVLLIAKNWIKATEM